jgi:hypothetical protein
MSPNSCTAVCCLVASACLLAALPARAAVQPQPGLWQETETGTENGRPAKPQTTKSCMTEAEAKDPTKGMVFDKEMQKHCKTLDVKRSGNDLSFRMECSQQGFAMNIVTAFHLLTPQHYSGTLKSSIKMGSMTMTSDKKLDAVRIGACKK